VRMRSTGAPDHREKKPGILNLRSLYADAGGTEFDKRSDHGDQEATRWTFIVFASFTCHSFH
jgi:hypothetical protein